MSDHSWARNLFGLADEPPAAPSHRFTGYDDVVAGVRVRALLLRGTASGAIPALLLEPESGADGPRVLAIHQHNDEYHLGKSEVAGLRGNPDIAYGMELAQLGCTVLVPDVKGFEGRAPGGDAAREEQRLAWDLVARGTSLAALHLADLREALSWLEQWPSASQCIGAVGHSLGGQLSLFLAAVDERVDAAVVSCGVGTLASFEATHDLLHNPSWYVPGLRTVGDVPALAAVVEGQRFWITSGATDPIFPVEGIREVTAAFPAGAAVVQLHPGGHELPGPERKLALDWLVRSLRRA